MGRRIGNNRTPLTTVAVMALVLWLVSCSTTSNLPEGEILYTGMKKTVVVDNDGTDGAADALDEVNAALKQKPNGSIFGSSRMTWPWPPFRLFLYNKFINADKKLGKWIFDRFATPPVLLSSVNPEMRSAAATNLLHDYGYFNGRVTHEIVPDRKNDRKSKVGYRVQMGHSYRLDTVIYAGFRPEADSLIRRTMRWSKLKPGDQFSVLKLDEERQRISTIFRSRGYFYFVPSYITFLGDTLQSPGNIALKVVPKAGLNDMVKRKWKVGGLTVNLRGYNNEEPTDSITYEDMVIHYEGKLRVRPSILYSKIKDKRGDTYSQFTQQKTQEALGRLGIFRYTELQYIPEDSTGNTLNRVINASYDYPLNGEFEMNVKSKSNNYLGPGASFSVSRKNVFGGGERLSLTLNGAYEWQTNVREKGQAVNSYEFGIDLSLEFPRVIFPRMLHRDFDYPASTKYHLYADQTNRASFFKLLTLGGGAEYKFRPNALHQHSITPFKLDFNLLQKTTARFDSITGANPALYLSLKDQFIPSMGYTYTYDNSSLHKRGQIWWQTSVTSSGNLLSCFYAMAGKGFGEEGKNLFGNPFSQFAKLTTELRYTYRINRRQSIAARVMGGIAYAYGNALVVPYSEQFYVGGANSIRAFTIRSIGPGRYHADEDNQYSYIDQTGDIKLEANVEWRFNIFGDLHGAVFLDAGNVWLVRADESRPGAEFTLKDFYKNIALGTGIGLRYDLDILVLRLDMGIGLHAPYDTGRSGYYNITSFGKGLGFHFAIGYPF